MNKYVIIYKLKNGFRGKEYVYAANRVAAWEIFESMSKALDIEECNCFRVIEEEEK